MKIQVEDFKIIYRNDSKFYKWEDTDIDSWRLIVADYFYTFIPTIGVLYLAGIYFGQKFMKSRVPYQIQKPLVAWNLFLAVFSAICAYKSIEHFAYTYTVYGFHAGSCHRTPITKTFGFWNLLFLLSKVFELGDTVFLVLRKKYIIFLHWFHHFTILLTMFFIFPKYEPATFYIILLNACVHTIMYFYFTLMAAQIRVPKRIAMCVTLVQMIQFVIGLSISSYLLAQKFLGVYCELSQDTFNYVTSLLAIYLCLFAKIFFGNYQVLKKNVVVPEIPEIRKIAQFSSS